MEHDGGLYYGYTASTSASPRTLGVNRKNELHAARTAGAVVTVPCRDARGGFLSALCLPTDLSVRTN